MFYLLKKIDFKQFISLLLALVLCLGIFAGCSDESQVIESTPPIEVTSENGEHPYQHTDEELFDILLDELFAEIMTQDSITLNYFLAEPSRYGIDPITPTYGEVTSQEFIERDRGDNRELSERLSVLSYESLRPDQQLTYDILDRAVRLFEKMDKNDDYYYYLGEIHPVSGIQIQLPVLLAEFNFRTVEDIEIYIQLLGDTQRYFSELIEFERERSARGFFMSDSNVDEVIANCESYLSNREDNLLILVFDDKIDEYPGLSSIEREDFKQRNRELVLNNVFPAYGLIVDAMRELRGKGANQGGLANLPNGAEYAALLLQSKTGSDKTPLEVKALLEVEMQNIVSSIQSLMFQDAALLDAYLEGSIGKINEESPEVYLRMLEKYIARDFPAMAPAKYVVNEVHESLQEHLSPAFYLAPAIDSYIDNVIYVNPAQLSDNLSLFTTLAHEGYPGHLYQNVYFLQQSPHPLRRMIGTLGYTEGWATYVEMWSYYQIGLGGAEAAMLQNDKLYSLLIYAMTDLGVNAFGWSFDETAAFLVEIGIYDLEVVGSLVGAVTADPLAYLPYCLGYYEFKALLTEAESALGDSFVLLEFHRFILDMGSMPFGLLHGHMQAWIETQRAGVLAPAA